MLFPDEFYEKSKCSQKERETLMPLFEKIIQLTKQVKQEGLLALEDRLEEFPDIFMKNLLQLAIDGIELETIRHSGMIMISSGNYQGIELLRRMMVLDWIIYLCDFDQYDHEIIGELIGVYLGASLFERYLEKLEKEAKEKLKKRMNGVDEIIKAISGKMRGKIQQNRKLNRELIYLDERALQRIMREISWHDLKRLIWIVSEKARKNIFMNVSRRVCQKLLDSKGREPHFWEPVKIAQQKILGLIEKLEKAGEIRIKF